MTRWRAHYQCVKCHRPWWADAGPTHCIHCGSLYVTWLNYVELARKG
jgi:hypothetical protein